MPCRRCSPAWTGPTARTTPIRTRPPAASSLRAKSGGSKQRLAVLQAEIDAITSPEIAVLDKQLAEWKAEFKALPEEEAKSQTLGYHSQIMPRQDATKWVQVDLGRSVKIDLIVLLPAHVAYGGHPGPGFGFPPRFKVEVSDDPEFADSQVVVDETREDYPNPGDVWQRFNTPGAKGRFVRVTATRLWNRTNDWIFALSELAVFSDGKNVATRAAVSALDSIEATPSWAKANLVDGFTSLKRVVDDAAQPSRRMELLTAFDRTMRTRDRRVSELANPATLEEIESLQGSLETVEKSLAQLPEQLTVYAAASDFTPQGAFAPPKHPRPIHRLARGDVRDPKELVAPGAVACVRGPSATFELSDPDNEGQRRAALAHWLVDPRNALLRRSIVNRVWQYHFGQGIVDSPNDFGRMGSLPTHPELLDWLAGWFAEHGHSLKALHRLLLTSSVYRQSSQSNPELSKLDAGNRYLWRMNRSRLDAECIRDAVLFVSGQLDLTMGGPSGYAIQFQGRSLAGVRLRRLRRRQPRQPTP